MKKYKLLKDISHPTCDTIKAGAIFSKPFNACKDTAYINKVCNIVFHPDRVENNPEWFEEVQEEWIREPNGQHWQTPYGFKKMIERRERMQFTHEDLREAFEAARINNKGYGRFINGDLLPAYRYATFEEYLGSKNA